MKPGLTAEQALPPEQRPIAWRDFALLFVEAVRSLGFGAEPLNLARRRQPAG